MSTNDKYLKESYEYSAEDAKFMEMAINLSVDNIDTGGGPFGAVIVKDGEIIATGTSITQITDCQQQGGLAQLIAMHSILRMSDRADCKQQL